MYLLRPDPNDLRFPPVERASPEGLLAIGGDLSAPRLLTAYRHGIFPWYSEGQPILWWSPDPRAVLFLERLKVSRSLRKTLRSGKFTVTTDRDFRAVMRACAGNRRGTPAGTWITPEMVEAYAHLHQLGYAHSVEVRAGETLAGGLYGVALGGAFFGESMFSRVTDASKVALAWLVAQLRRWGFLFIDCQLPSDHLFSLGAEEIPRARFLGLLAEALQQADRLGRWELEPDLALTAAQPVGAES
jgi:leucyl/phenylalanyl-tRNA--protein transferase